MARFFFWRYTHPSPAVRGVDESATVPTDADASYVQKGRVADDDKPVFKFAIYDEEEKLSYCFGSKPWFSKGNNLPTG